MNQATSFHLHGTKAHVLLLFSAVTLALVPLFYGTDTVLKSSQSGHQSNGGAMSTMVKAIKDTDGDGLTDDIDEDDDNDGLPDLFEDGCEMSTTFGAPPATVASSNHVTAIYSDYGGFWESHSSAVNPVAFDNVSTLLAFEVGSNTYATGVAAPAMLDANGNGKYDGMDTNGDGIADVAVEETEWEALRPVTKIKSGVRLEGRAIDGNLSGASGPLLTTGGIPFNPYLYEGEHGLDMAYAIANIGNAWYFRLGGTNTPAYGDGVMDILLTQGAQLGGGGNYNTLHLLDEDGNYLGHGVKVDWNTTPVVGNSYIDQYNANDSPSQANVKKNLRFAAVELSEFGLSPSERNKAVIFRLEISENADPIFFAVNQNSFITTCPKADTDGDGIVNSLDLDSDNDGILDAVEAGHGEALVDGRLSGPVGDDGIPNVVQAPSQYNNGTVDYEVKDSDNDNILDFMSYDSDSDGCYDVAEAGYADGDADGFLGQGNIKVDKWGRVKNSGGYTTPADANGNGTFDYREAGSAPVIATQPLNTLIPDGQSGTISVSVTNVSAYQWQISTDGGATFTNLANGGHYSGVQSNILHVNNVDMSMEGYVYRVQLENSAYVCDPLALSTGGLLDVGVRNVITNRHITYRVNKMTP